MEPRENIPRILVELFERYGDSNMSTEIKDYLEIQGIKYVNVFVKGDVFSLPSCSLQVSENAYFLRTCDEKSCNTEKTKSRFYHRTGGVLVMAKPCGVIVSMVEIFGGESVSQVPEVFEYYLENSSSDGNENRPISFFKSH